MVYVNTTRYQLALDLRTYGEDQCASAVPQLTDEQMSRIGEIAGHLVSSPNTRTASGASMLLAKAVALAAVEVIEGKPRDLKWKRRKLKGIYPGV